MAVSTKVSLEEYLQLHFKPERELVEGELVPKPMGTLEHMDLERRIEKLLEPFEEREVGHTVRELSVRGGGDVRIPDVVFVPRGARFENGLLLDPALLCVEVLSPSQRLSELFAKCEAYHNWGVPHCWVLDPLKKLAWQYDRESPVTLLPGDGVLRGGAIGVSLTELFG